MVIEEKKERIRPEDIGLSLTRERLLIFTLLATTALAFYLCYLLARPFLSAFAWALALAVIAHPFHGWIARRIRHPNLAAGLAVVGVAFVVVAPAIIAARQIIGEAVAGVEIIRAEQGQWREAIEQNPRLAAILRWAEGQINLQDAVAHTEKVLSDNASSLLTGSVWMVAESLITSFFFTIFFATVIW
jgi:predicted PurR-regulated permease PerM